MNKKENVLIICLIGVIILLSWVNLNSSQDLENRMRQMQSEIGSLSSQITHEVSRVSNVVHQIQEEASWWTPGETEILEVGKDEAEVKISWFLREYQEGSLVTFNYRQGREGNFNSINAEKGSEGYYYSVLPIEMTKEPIWENSISRSSSNSRNTEEIEVVNEEKNVFFNQMMYYEYYISVTKDGTTRTGEVRNIDLGKLSFSLFNPLYSHISIHEDRPIIINLVEGNAYYDVYYNIEEVYVESRIGNRRVEKWPLEKDDGNRGSLSGENIYDTLIITEKDYDAIYIVIKYNEGFTAEKKIK